MSSAPVPSLSPRAIALIVLIGAACVLGLAPILVRLTETGPAAAGFWRFAFAMPLLLLVTARPGAEGTGRPGRWAALAGLFFVLDLSFWHYGIVMTSVANATVLCNLTPVVVTLFAWLAFRADGGQGTNPLLGDLFSLSVAVWYSGYFLAVKAARRTMSASRVMLWSTGIGTPLLLMVALVLGENILPAGRGGWMACIALGVMHVVGQGGVAWALGRLPAGITAVTILIQPVVAAGLSWLVFAETMTPIQMLGGAVVLAAVVLAQWSARPKTQTGTEPAGPAPVNL